MAKAPPKPKKTVSEANLARLGADRLAALLIEAGQGDPGFKRRLRMELAAEVGAPDLALELDKRLQTLGGSRARISWRKRPELIRELRVLSAMIIDRLAPMDPKLALDRLIAWFDLGPLLGARTKDPKGEVAAVFDDATSGLARLSNADITLSAPLLLEALDTRSSAWASIIARAAPDFDIALSRALLTGLTSGKRALAGRAALVARRLADRAGDLDAWLATLSPDDRRKPEVSIDIARRLAGARRAVEAREALEAARPSPPASRWGSRPEPIDPGDTWRLAEIAVLDAEGQAGPATEARWALFERTLSPDLLRDLISSLGDFEDVVAIDRAVAHASGYFDLMRGLAFLMDWGALREAAAAIETRADELRGQLDATPLWASRLSGRYPAAAVLLLRARVRSLRALGAYDDDEVAVALSEAEGLHQSLPAGSGIPDHAAFVATLGRPRGR
jgi:hypothetical protein